MVYILAFAADSAGKIKRQQYDKIKAVTNSKHGTQMTLMSMMNSDNYVYEVKSKIFKQKNHV